MARIPGHATRRGAGDNLQWAQLRVPFAEVEFEHGALGRLVVLCCADSNLANADPFFLAA